MSSKQNRTVKITDTKLQSWLKKSPAHRGPYFDTGGDGFAVRAGKRRLTFLYIHRELRRWDPKMRVKWATIGYYAPLDDRGGKPPLPFMTLADVRAKHRELVAFHLTGGCVTQKLAEEAAALPGTARNDDAVTVQAAGDQYLDHQVREGLRTVHQDRQYLDRFIYPKWGTWSIMALNGSKGMNTLRPLIHGIRDGKEGSKPSPSMAKNLRAVLNRLFDFALGEGWIDANPIKGIKTPTVGRRDGYLKQRQIGEFWVALEEHDMQETAKLGAQFLFLTALRRNEANIRRDWIIWDDPEHGDHIQIPASRMKNKRPYLLPICIKLKEVIKKAESLHDGPMLFRTLANRWAEHLAKHRKDMGFPDFLCHDIRRSFNTDLQRQRIPQRHIDAALSHTIAQGVEGHYNLYEYADEKRECLEAWEKEIQRLAAEVRRSRIQAVEA